MTESFGWEYHRASILVALAHNRVAATGRLYAAAEEQPAKAAELCAIHGLGSWARRAAALRAAALTFTDGDAQVTRRFAHSWSNGCCLRAAIDGGT